METKFTKGEWKLANYGQCFAIETTLPNGQEHTLFTDSYCYASKFDGNSEANAKLIAAAPEMLVALNEMCEMWEQMSKALPTIINEPRYINAISIIKKATE